MEEESITWHTYCREDLYLLPGDPSKKYFPRKGHEKTVIAWGQRKLALVVLEFINLYWDPEKVPNPILVYAGASPCKNLNFITSLYPNITWHLYDPKGIFDIKSASNIFTYKEPFDVNTAQRWSDQDVYFISDIRTIDRFEIENKYPKEKVSEMIERGIWLDMLAQQEWVEIMRPIAAQLKFRLPYSDIKFSDDIDHEKGYAPYLAGVVFKQPWIGPSSTETRLVTTRKDMQNGKYPKKNWSIKSYEDELFFHNAIVREKHRYYNPFYTDERKETPIISSELNNQWDSLAELLILNDYLTKVKYEGNRLLLINQLHKLLTLKLSVERKQVITLSFLRENPLFLRKVDPDDE